MSYLLTPLTHTFNKTLEIPGSKSITNRALLLSALANGISTLHGMLNSADTTTVANALSELGIVIEWNKNNHQCRVHGKNGIFPRQKATINCHDAGTAARFLLAACGNQCGEYFFTGSQRLCQRPHAELIKALCQLGAVVEPAQAVALPLTLKNTGKLSGGEINVSSSDSSQFISALLMIAPYMANSLTLHCEKLQRHAYIDMTCNMMQQFGINVQQLSPDTFFVDNQQCYQACDYYIEPDLSTASYFFAAAALTASQITIPNIDYQHCLQGDIKFVDVLKNMGCHIGYTNKKITLQGPQQLQGITSDMNDFSDPFITLAALAPFAQSPTTITNIAHTRLQESDRIDSVAHNLSCLSIRCETGHDYLTIYPGKISVKSTLSSFNDHRIVMAFSLLSLKIPGIAFDNTQCINKTCPEFFELMGTLHTHA